MTTKTKISSNGDSSSRREFVTEIVCVDEDCLRRFKSRDELLIFIPPPLDGKQYAGHLKCPYCRGNKFYFIEKKSGGERK